MNTHQVRQHIAKHLDIFPGVKRSVPKAAQYDSRGFEVDAAALRRDQCAQEAILADAAKDVAKLERAKSRRSNSQLVKLQRGNSQHTSSQLIKLKRAGHHVVNGRHCSCGNPRCLAYPG